MRYLLLSLALLLLAACDPPKQEFSPARYYTVRHDNVPYGMRAEFDPLAAGWFIRVAALSGIFDLVDPQEAIAFVEDEMSPRLCGGGRLSIEPGEIWNPLAGDRITPMPTLPGWQFLARCA